MSNIPSTFPMEMIENHQTSHSPRANNKRREDFPSESQVQGDVIAFIGDRMSAGEVTFRFTNAEIRQFIINRRKFTEEQATRPSPNKPGYTLLQSRVDFALSHLFHVGLVIRESWGHYRNFHFDGHAKRVISTEILSKEA